jgi:hypothetical protein
LTATQQDRLLRFADIVKRELDASGRSVALVSRSGLSLERFSIRYSHAGVSLKASENGAWSVRQLYFACDEGRPRLFDQGMAGFASGTDDPALGYISIVLLPHDQGAVLERAALDRARALQLIGSTYSANAYPFALRYQNCNQWLIELIASAWGALDVAGPSVRPQAQRWLAEQGYAPAEVQSIAPWWWVAAAFVPWLRFDDHPQDDRAAARVRTSLPSSIEAFVRERVPLAERIELCHDSRRVVVRRGWTPIASGCHPAPGDRVVEFGEMQRS